MDTLFLEQFYETVILPQYVETVVFKTIAWKDHGRVGPDAIAHYFDDENGREYVLLYEDFPDGTPFGDGLSHEVVLCKDEESLNLSFEVQRQIENILGYFTLFREK
jgi:hypothetical protein